MKVFIDLGAYTGDTLEEAMEIYTDVDMFYGFEPFENSFNEMSGKLGNLKNVILIKKAVSDINGAESLFLKISGAEGHSLCSNKSNVSKNHIEIESIDFSKFILENFKKSDEIILKVNIEGAEYKLFQKMIKDGSIAYISKIFCEWHYVKVSGVKDVHNEIVASLKKLGFDLIGDNRDAFVNYVDQSKR